MVGMFEDCKSLARLDVRHFNTSKVGVAISSDVWAPRGSMRSMFSGCRSLTSLDVSQFITNNVTDMSSMFFGCRSLTSLDVSGFDISKVTDASHFAGNCNKLTLLNLGHNDFLAISKHEQGFLMVDTVISSTSDLCRLIETFGREPLGPATIAPDNQVPPYYNYCGGYFTVAETLDTGADYTPTAKADADLWVKGRKLKAGVWNTFVVPVSVTQEQLKTAFGDDVEVGVLSGYDGKTVTFTNITGSIAANTPMLVKPTRDINNVGFVAVDIVACSTDAPTTTVTDGNLTARFIGSYKQQITIGNDCFYYYNGKFLRSAGNSTVGCTRGYFTFSDGGTGAKQFVLDNGGEPTAIDTIDGQPVGPQGPAYNLAGQRVGDDYKGIVIVNGKKVLRK